MYSGLALLYLHFTKLTNITNKYVDMKLSVYRQLNSISNLAYCQELSLLKHFSSAYKSHSKQFTISHEKCDSCYVSNHFFNTKCLSFKFCKKNLILMLKQNLGKIWSIFAILTEKQNRICWLRITLIMNCALPILCRSIGLIHHTEIDGDWYIYP